MSVTSETNKVSYVGTGLVSVYDFPYRLLNASDLIVIVRDTDDAETTLVLNSDYTIDGVGSYSGGTITLSDDLTDDYVISLIRDPAVTQALSLQAHSTYYATESMDALDKLTMIAQAHKESLDRSLKLPRTIDADDIDPTLPVPSGDARYFRWNEAGTALENYTSAVEAADAPADNTVTTAAIINLAVTTGKIADLAVTTGKINDLAVTTGKINDLAVTAGKIAADAVTTAKILDANVTTAKLADASVTYGKLASNLLSSGRNMLANGSGTIAQRPAYIASVSGTYGYGAADHWAGAITGSTVSGTFTALATSQIAGAFQNVRWISITTTGSGIVYFRQRIEARDTYRFLGKALYFNCLMQHNVGTTQTAQVTIKHATVLNDFTATTLIETSATVSVATGTDVNVGASFAAIAASNKNGLEIEISLTVGAVTNKSVWLANAQLEIYNGSGASSFEYLPYEVELLRCQRYYWSTFPSGTAPAQNCGSNVGAILKIKEGADATFDTSENVRFPVQMFAIPTVTFYNPGAANSKWRNITDAADSGASSTGENLSYHGFTAINAGAAGDTEGTDHLAVHITAEAEL